MRNLHHLALIICTVIGIVVFGVLGYSLVKFRKSQGAQAAKFSHSTKAEIIWTIVPVLILVGLAIPTARVLIEMEDTAGGRSQDQGHRLPVEVALRVPGPRHQLLQQHRRRQQCCVDGGRGP